MESPCCSSTALSATASRLRSGRRSSHSATSAIPGRKLVQREEGALYRALWEQAIADDPDWILISSFNQWHNGTEIEPSVEMGDRYLTLTRELSTRFKKRSGQ